MKYLILSYLIGWLICFGFICYDEIKSFVKVNMPFIFIGFFASFLWPIILIELISVRREQKENGSNDS